MRVRSNQRDWIHEHRLKVTGYQTDAGMLDAIINFFRKAHPDEIDLDQHQDTNL